MTAFLMTTFAPEGLRPFAELELLGQPVYRYAAKAAEQAGLSPIFVGCAGLREGDCCPGLGEAAELAKKEEAVLLIRAEGFSLTQECLKGLLRMGPGACLTAAGRCYAAYCTGTEGARMLQAGILESAGLRTCAPEQLDPGCSWIDPGACTRQDYHRAAEALRQQVLGRLRDAGVLIPCGDGVMVSAETEIGPDTLLLPGTILTGRCRIGRDCVIGPNTVMADSVAGDRTVIESSRITRSQVGCGVKIGPYAQLRPDCRIGDGVKIGDFVEIKNSAIGARTSVAHLTYIGDSDVGSRVNFGCGTVTSNYDGIRKSRTRIGDNAFIGCNTNLVAPVTVGDGAYTAAGSTITEDVPSGALAVARSRQTIKPGWAEQKWKEKQK